VCIFTCKENISKVLRKHFQGDEVDIFLRGDYSQKNIPLPLSLAFSLLTKRKFDRLKDLEIWGTEVDWSTV
jgi:hypothetical protein